MKYTVLELTQKILSSLDSEEIDSIGDTVEAAQVVDVIETAYYDIVSRRPDLPEHKAIVNLTATSSSTPTMMTIPSTVSEILWVKYNQETADDTDDRYVIVQPKTLEDFLQDMHNLDISDTTNVGNYTYTSGGSSVVILYDKTVGPRYYTSFNDDTVLFDCMDAEVDTYLTAAKTFAFARVSPTFTKSDAFTPDLDEPEFALLLNEAKALAFAELKQTVHQKAEVNSRRGWVTLQRRQDRIKTPSFFDSLPNYGRK